MLEEGFLKAVFDHHAFKLIEYIVIVLLKLSDFVSIAENQKNLRTVIEIYFITVIDYIFSVLKHAVQKNKNKQSYTMFVLLPDLTISINLSTSLELLN